MLILIILIGVITFKTSIIITLLHTELTIMIVIIFNIIVVVIIVILFLIVMVVVIPVTPAYAMTSRCRHTPVAVLTPVSVLQVRWVKRVSISRPRCSLCPRRLPSPTCLPCPTWTARIPSATLSSPAPFPRRSRRLSTTDLRKWPLATPGDGNTMRQRTPARMRDA